MSNEEFKKNRARLNVSQTFLANELGVSLRTVQNWESGANIPRSKHAMLHKYFDSYLTSEENSTVSVVKPNLRLENNHGNQFEELEDGSYVITVDEIPFEAHASYLESLENPTKNDVIFSKVSFTVDKFGKGNYKGFKIKGDSMNGGRIDDTPDGASVLGRELGRQHWMDGFNHTQYGWIIMCDCNIFHKDILSLSKEKGTITCHSRNESPEYSDFELELNSLKKVFKVIKRTF